MIIMLGYDLIFFTIFLNEARVTFFINPPTPPPTTTQSLNILGSWDSGSPLK